MIVITFLYMETRALFGIDICFLWRNKCLWYAIPTHIARSVVFGRGAGCAFQRIGHIGYPWWVGLVSVMSGMSIHSFLQNHSSVQVHSLVQIHFLSQIQIHLG